MESSRVALLAMLSICFIGLLCLTEIGAAQQLPLPATVAPPQTGRPQPAPPPGSGPGQVPGQVNRPLGRDLIRNHPGKIGGEAYVAHVKRHPHPGFVPAENTSVQVVRNYYFIILRNGYPYYDGGYIDVDPQLDCYTWYDGDDLYPPGWYWTCDR